MNESAMFVKKICDTAKKATLAAGELQRHNFHNYIKIQKTFAHDLKLEIDRESERIIFEILKKDFPDFSFITEESGILRADASSVRGNASIKENEKSYVWIVDPLDGSVNYYAGIPYFCVCIACYKMTKEQLDTLQRNEPLKEWGEPVAGVVYVPIQDEMYYAAHGGGAYCNDLPIKCGNYQALAECLVLVTCGSLTASTWHIAHVLPEISRKSLKVRMFGATGLDIVNVARGGAGVFFQEGPHLWDFAASRIILSQAGGYWEDSYLENGRYKVMATAPSQAIWNEMKEILSNEESN